MAGFKGVLDITLENGGPQAYDSVKVEVFSDLIDGSVTWNTRLGVGRTMHKKFPVRPDMAGIELIRFQVAAQVGRDVKALWAETDVTVFEKTEDLRSISIQADNIVGVGSVAEDAKSMGNAVRGQMESLIRMDKIKNATDLMREFRSMPPQYFALRLEEDPLRSRQLTATLCADRARGGKHILDPMRGSLAESACLRFAVENRPVNIVLVAQAEVTLGKHRNSHIVTRVLPRSPEHDEMSNRLSRSHCLIRLTHRGVTIKDNQTVNGSVLDEQPLGDRAHVLGPQSRRLDMAGVFSLDLHLCVDANDRMARAGYDQLPEFAPEEMWMTAAEARINALSLRRHRNLGHEDKHGQESYCLVYRLATLGADPHCAICVPDQGLEKIHAGLLFFNSRFYLENVSGLTDVSVNDQPLNRHELIPLRWGDRLQIKRLQMEFKEAGQLYL
jgi:pSer/pThr/pTyr-binding forkhead associated (FHA) protein